MKNNKGYKKNLTILFSMIAIFFTGFPHVWSLYSPYVIRITNWTREQVSMCFYLAFFTFVFGNIVGGRIQDNAKPLRVLAVGGLLQSLGVLLSAYLMIANPIPLYLTFGVMQGFGQGMVYAVLLATAQKWYPKRKGFGSGIVITFNGLSGLLLTPLSRFFLAEDGPQKALQVIAGLMAIAWAGSVLFIRQPEDTQEAQTVNGKTEKDKKKQYTSKEMMQTKRFYLLVASMCLALIPYLLISPIAQGLQMERGLHKDIAAGAIMTGAALNALARIVVPALSDRFGRIYTIRVVYIIMLVASGGIILARTNLMFICVVILFGCYGAVMGSFPSIASSIFGTEHAAENYGYIMIGVILATGLAPLISALPSSKNGVGIDVFLIIGFICSILACICITLLKKELSKVLAE